MWMVDKIDIEQLGICKVALANSYMPGYIYIILKYKNNIN